MPISTHATLLNLSKRLGCSKINHEGLCHGFIMRWLEAVLLGEKERRRFERRIDLILSLGDQLANAIRTAIAKKLARTDDDGILLEIPTFFKSLVLFHNPRDYRELFNRDCNQNDIELISLIASSREILAQGGLISPYSEVSIYTKAELIQYLTELGIVLQASSPNSSNAIGMILSNYNHAIALSYLPNIGWCLRDINQTEQEPTNSLDKIAQDIILSFPAVTQSNTNSIAMDVQMVITKHDPRTNYLLLNLAEFKASHLITPAMISNPSIHDLIYIAAQQGYIELIAQLAPRINPAQLNQMHHTRGSTPVWIAAQNNHPEVIAAFAPYLSFRQSNQADRRGITPCFIAAYYGHANIIAMLTNHHDPTQLNQPNANNETLAWVAAKNGHERVVTILASRLSSEQLNQVNNEGITPVWIAAQNGHERVVTILASRLSSEQLNQVNNYSETSIYVAAHNGHEGVVAILASHLSSEQLNQAIHDKPAIALLEKFAANKLLKEERVLSIIGTTPSTSIQAATTASTYSSMYVWANKIQKITYPNEEMLESKCNSQGF